jgi:hypothetical protein
MRWIWCGIKFHSWINSRVIRDKRVFNYLRVKYEDLIIFSSYYEASKWIHDEILKKIDVKREDWIEPYLSHTDCMRCHDDFYYWIEQYIQPNDLFERKGLYFSTYAEATEWIHDNILVHVSNVKDLKGFV